ncbi:YcnI family protein [Promicromonospora sp. NPDC023805]|uniref:YcnI family copper-binding membrane protein n=1 Tax=Promicromonospora sp. NPDC023805 TaxID=3154696 RepID=UPI0033C2D802
MNLRTAVRRATLTGLAAAGIVALGATSAMAHVTITPSTTAAGATAELRVEIPHGCVGSATTAISIRMPEGVSDVTASGTDRWAVKETADALTWTTGEPLPDTEHAVVEFSVRLPDDDGATLVFPVIQQCEQGEAAWTEVAEHGEGHDGLERPAPVLVVTPGEPEAGSATADAEARSPLVTYGAAGVLAAGVLAGGAVLLRRRRRP